MDGHFRFFDFALLRSEYLMRVATLTTCNENMRGVETGDHKGQQVCRGLFS